MSRRSVALIALALVLLGAIVGLVLRSDDGDPAAPPTEAGAPVTTVDEPATLPTRPPEGSEPVPTSAVEPEAEARARAVLADAGPRLALTDPQLACLENRVAADPAMLDAVGDRPQPGSEGFGVLVTEGEWCVAFVTLAPAFVDGVAPSLTTPLDDRGRACLRQQYADLDPTARQAIAAAGLRPDGEEAAAGRAELDALLERCGLARQT